MTNPERLSESPLPTISELLLELSKKYKALQEAAREKLYGEEDTDGYRQSLRESNELIAGLPELILEYKRKGGTVSERLEYTCWEYAGMAREFLDQNSIVGMLGLLAARGSLMDDPDALERLAAENEL